LYTSCVLGLRPFALFYELLLIKKKKYVSKDSPPYAPMTTLQHRPSTKLPNFISITHQQKAAFSTIYLHNDLFKRV
jgi:hypothetical protein